MITSLFGIWKKDRKPGASTLPNDSNESPTGEPANSAALSRLEVTELLKYVIDPEVGLNIVDLGLVYDVELEKDRISVKLTMTTPACPMSSYLSEQVRTTLEHLDGVKEVDVQLVWQPSWTPQMMDPDAVNQLWGG